MVTIIHLCYGLCEFISCISCRKVRDSIPVFSLGQYLGDMICNLCLLFLLTGQCHSFFQSVNTSLLQILLCRQETCFYDAIHFYIWLILQKSYYFFLFLPISGYLNNLTSSQASDNFLFLIWYGTHKFTIFLCCYTKTIQLFKLCPTQP